VSVGNPIEEKKLQRSPHEDERPAIAADVRTTGQTALVSGIYLVEHTNHDGGTTKQETVVLKGTMFPACAVCGEPLNFVLKLPVKHITEDSDFCPSQET
jgi:hypothetical protein